MNAAAADLNPNRAWYAIYTRSRHEKALADSLAAMRFTVFLPLVEKSWRISVASAQKVHLPLFPGYVFAEFDCTAANYQRVQTAPGFVYLVGAPGRPARIPASQIESVRRIIASRVPCSPVSMLRGGASVTVTSGPLAGLKGKFIRRKKQDVFVVSLDFLRTGILVEIERHRLDTTDDVSPGQPP